MIRKLLLLICFGVMASCAACTSSVESKNTIGIELKKDSYKFTDQEISYVIVNNAVGEIDCMSYGDLEKKNGGNWEKVPSTIPDPVSWCGTLSTLNPGETQCTIPFLSYNGTLAAGTYRIAFNYSLRNEGKSDNIYSDEFALTGEFPMSDGYPAPANVYLAFEADVFSKSSPEIAYRIMNESGGEVFISPNITLMLYQNSEWKSFVYSTSADGEITSSDRENFRIISAEKLPDGFENCSKIRIIEQIAIPMRNVFYAFYEINLD
ncbi:MAG: immunoglobulin-like domain-containing protein [Bacillota bacterium]